jgi:fatty-acyl-CoA synthase
VAIVKSDMDTGDVMRGPDGRCLRCAPDEVGEAIGRLSGAGSGTGGRFEGYTDPRATEKKVLRHVFAEGDAWYRTGDLMRKDRAGYFYFADRIGDTFRWKGENVSTNEVEEIVVHSPNVTDAVIYGVSVPGADGRAGMAALVTETAFELSRFADHLGTRLPEYARPLFVRLCSRIATTGTFKPQKQALAREGFDPGVIADPVYVWDRGSRNFVPLDGERLSMIQRGEMRF